MLEIRKPSLKSELIDNDVSSGREGIPEDRPDRLEQAMERVVQRTSAFAGLILTLAQVVGVGRGQLAVV